MVRKRSAFVFVAVLMLYLLTSPGVLRAGRSARRVIQLIETGEFHGDEVSARTGQHWLGLYTTKRSSALLLSMVTVRRVHDEVLDEEPNARTGKKVSVDRGRTPLFLVRGFGILHAGPVVTIRGAARPLKNRSTTRLALSGVEYRLRVVTKSRNPGGIPWDEAKLVLSSGEHTQVPYKIGGQGRVTEVGPWQLIWAGDLDGDHKLDLYIDVDDSEDGSDRILFLSSHARKGQLVRQVAEFSTVGC